MTKILKFAPLFIAACTVSTGASAHTGHGTHSLMEGLAHPFGADHLLADQHGDLTARVVREREAGGDRVGDAFG